MKHKNKTLKGTIDHNVRISTCENWGQTSNSVSNWMLNCVSKESLTLVICSDSNLVFQVLSLKNSQNQNKNSAQFSIFVTVPQSLFNPFLIGSIFGLFPRIICRCSSLPTILVQKHKIG